jgi:cytochrome P450
MSPYYVLCDPEIFVKPFDFIPERWLAPDAKEKLEPYYVPFGKGPRICVGMHLAYAELHTIAAAVIRRFPTLQLYDTSPDDVKNRYDFFAPMWKYEEGKPGLQVKG